MILQEINQLTIVAYDSLADKYHRSFKDELAEKEYDRSLLDKFSNSVGLNGIICDAGCGPSGHIGKYLQQKGHRVIGIDISPRCIEIASEYEDQIEFKCMDMTDTTFEPNSFDGILSYYSIIHTPKTDASKIFEEFNRILKPDGKLLLVVKKGTNEGVTDDSWYEGHPIYFSHFEEDELINALGMYEFKIDFIDTRKPYDTEIEVERIYIIATKK